MFFGKNICLYRFFCVILRRNLEKYHFSAVICIDAINYIINQLFMSMRKISYFLGAALMALVLMPQTMLADECEFTPNLFPGQAADRTAKEVSAKAVVGEFGMYDMHIHSQVNNLTSSDQMIVKTVNENGYDGVFFVGVGQADVTYTENWFTSAEGGADGGVAGGEDGSGVCPSNHTIHYTVEQGTPQAYYAFNNEPITEFRTPYNAFNAPYLQIIVKEVRTVDGYPKMMDLYINEMQCTITSSNEAVATIGRGGHVQLTGELGETVITAYWPGTALWKEATASYKLKVENPKQSVLISFSETEFTDTIGHTMYPPTPLIVPSEAKITRWVSSDPEVASVDSKTGVVTMLKAGKTNISAWVDEDDTYYAAQAVYHLTVVKKKVDMSFTPDVLAAELGVPVPELPKLNNPSNLPINKWYSQNHDVAEISEDGKTLTLKSAGEVLISCETYDTEEFSAGVVSFRLVVTTSGLTVKGVYVTSLNADDILGDGKVNFEKETKTLHLHEVIIDAQGSSYEVSEGVIRYEGEGALTIMIHGSSAIVHSAKSIVAENNGILLRAANKRDTLTLLAGDIAINAQAFKIHEGSLYAETNQVAIKLTSELSVSKGGHLIADGETGIAIECADLILADGEAGIEILTPDVRYEPKKGFLTKDNQPAHRVEIGKKPIVVPDDEETVIEFAVKDPDGNESVVFSHSVNDTYNEETGQLEISTALTDEQVAEALESVVPGSSAWVSFLPGSLTFDIPAGTGEILIECLTLPGYTLNVKLEGEAAISITQADKFGWAKVKYDVAAPTHVVIYLHAAVSSPAPAHIAAHVRDEDPSAGAYIKAIKITPSKAATGIEEIIPTVEGTQKIMLNGQLFIIRDGKAFNATGAQVK